MKVRVLVRLKPGVLDVQGKAVERGLTQLGYDSISNVRVGRMVEVDVTSTTLDGAKDEIKEICDKLLANPIIEQYEIVEAV
ncbi:MAG: phosphoribosylformylglycinamidine synthase subunit PurS [Bdellovibrionales bacterium]|nr:phosphoribosylformylglycinamidine synthase subunit PurS [Bdellovibrionales bacterium]